MPINVNAKLPAVKILSEEGIFVMTDERACHQDIRPLRIAIMNLMPTKVVTETQLLRVLSNTSIQVEVTLLHTKSHESKNTSQTHLDAFYRTIDDVKRQRFDGLIITGAPVENIPFEEVDYWDELTEIMEWSKRNVWSTLHICWGAQAGLYYHYGVPKHALSEKMFGVFEHRVLERREPLVRGFDDVFYAPHSRHTGIDRADVAKVPQLRILCESDIAGVYMVISNDGRQAFITGHGEYDPDTLRQEYERDIGRGIDMHVPYNYFPNDDPTKDPIVRWRSHGNLAFANWLNYYVYQETPFDLLKLV